MNCFKAPIANTCTWRIFCPVSMSWNSTRKGRKHGPSSARNLCPSYFNHFLFHCTWCNWIVFVMKFSNIITRELLPSIGSHVINWQESQVQIISKSLTSGVRERERERETTASNSTTGSVTECGMINRPSSQLRSFFNWHIIPVSVLSARINNRKLHII